MFKIIRYYIYILFSLLVLSCNKTIPEKKDLVKEAEISMKKYIREVNPYVSGLNLENINTVFKNDSLIILHSDMTILYGNDKKKTDKIEYIRLTQQGCDYETFNLGEDSIYIDSLIWLNTKNNKLYKDLTYDNTLRYLAALDINAYGRVVGDSTYRSVSIDEPIDTHSWQLGTFENTDEEYIFIKGMGYNYYSNNPNDRIVVTLGISKRYFFLKIFDEEKNKTVTTKGFYQIDIKGYNKEDMLFKGSQINLTLINISGNLVPAVDINSDYENFINILKKSYKIFIVVNDRQYVAKLKVVGFNQAYKLLNNRSS